MATPQPLPSTGAQPSSPGSDMGSYADMMGVQGGAQANNSEQLRKQQMESAGMQVRTVSQQLDAMAKQYPAVAKDIQALQQGMTKVLVKIIGSSQSESQAPTGALG